MECIKKNCNVHLIIKNICIYIQGGAISTYVILLTKLSIIIRTTFVINNVLTLVIPKLLYEKSHYFYSDFRRYNVKKIKTGPACTYKQLRHHNLKNWHFIHYLTINNKNTPKNNQITNSTYALIGMYPLSKILRKKTISNIRIKRLINRHGTLRVKSPFRRCRLFRESVPVTPLNRNMRNYRDNARGTPRKQMLRIRGHLMPGNPQRRHTRRYQHVRMLRRQHMTRQRKIRRRF